MKYFEAYEAKRNLHKKVKPGTVWRPNSSRSLHHCLLYVESVNLESQTIGGMFNGIKLCGRDSIKWLVKYYDLVE